MERWRWWALIISWIATAAAALLFVWALLEWG